MNTEFATEFLTNLSYNFSEREIQIISNELNRTLSNYNVTKINSFSLVTIIKNTLGNMFNWFKCDGNCPNCGGYLVQDKCDTYIHRQGFYKIYTCTKCGKEWTAGTSI